MVWQFKAVALLMLAAFSGSAWCLSFCDFLPACQTAEVKQQAHASCHREPQQAPTEKQERRCEHAPYVQAAEMPAPGAVSLPLFALLPPPARLTPDIAWSAAVQRLTAPVSPPALFSSTVLRI